MFKINNLNVSVNDKNILNDLNLEMPDGQIHVIMGKNGIGKVVVPADNNLTVTYYSQDVVQTFNIYYHYQDANDGNGYSVLKKYTTNISLPANYDSSDPDLTNRDLINSKKICESENVLTHFTYNNAISYLDRSKSEINCYFDRELVSVTFDKSDSYVTGVTVAPTDNNSVGSTSITSTTTYKYRYGQEVFMKIKEEELEEEFLEWVSDNEIKLK